MKQTQQHELSLSFVFALPYAAVFTMLGILVCVGCAPQPGYVQIENEWHYVPGGGIGDSPSPRRLEVDNDTFRVYADTLFARDFNVVLHAGSVIPKADPKTFEPIGTNGYARDKFRVYLTTHVVQRADPNTFKTLGYPYAVDNKHAFCGTLPMTIAKLDEFTVTKVGGLIATTRYGPNFHIDIENYDEEIDSSQVVVYGTECEACAGSQRFIGPVLKK